MSTNKTPNSMLVSPGGGGGSGPVDTAFSTAIKYDLNYRNVATPYNVTAPITLTRDVTGAIQGGETLFSLIHDGTSAINLAALLSNGNVPLGVDMTAISEVGRTYVISAFLDSGGYSYGVRKGALVIAAPVFSAQSAPGGSVGTAYGYTFVASGSPTYALGTGSLPAGLTLSSGGILSGTPTTAATSAFTVNATNGGGATVSSAQSVVIGASGYSTTFTGADSTSVIAGFDNQAGALFGITGNKAYQSNGTTYACATHTHTGPSPHYVMNATVTIAIGAANIAAILRYVDGSNQVVVASNADGSYDFLEVVAGSVNNLFHSAAGVVLGSGASNVIDVTFSSTMVATAVVNGASSGAKTLTGPLSNKHGISCWGQPQPNTYFTGLSMS